MKVCVRCQEPRPVAEFRPMPSCKDGLDSWCRDCHREYSREHARKNRERYRVMGEDRREARRQADEPFAAASRAAREAESPGPACPVAYGSCESCAEPYVSRRSDARFCSNRCRNRNQAKVRGPGAWPHQVRRRVPIVDHVCPECRASFRGKIGRKFCKPICGIRYNARANNHMRRRFRKTARVELVFRSDIFDRDEGICGICGLAVDLSRSGMEPLGPTLDHIVPVVDGGEHTADNLQLAHRVCNMRKGPHRRKRVAA